MEGETKETTEKVKNRAEVGIIKTYNYKWFYSSFEDEDRKEIFKIIYNSLFKKIDSIEVDDLIIPLKDYINRLDDKFINKSKEEILKLFKINEKEINKQLEEYKINLVEYNKYYLKIEDINKKYYIVISCLRKIRFEDDYEWICSPNHLLYFQSKILKYKKPSRIISIEEKDEKVETIDNFSKADILLKDEYFIYIKDSGVQNIDYNKIFEESRKQFDYSKENISKYLDYNDNDPKQIIDSELTVKNNYIHLLSKKKF